jgi:hypothetical protein
MYRTKSFKHVLIKVTGIVLLLFIWSCIKDEETNKVIEQSIDLQIENEKFKIVNESFVVNENCNSIFVSIIYDKGKKEPHFIFELSITKKGILKKVSYTRFGESTSPFDTPDFNLKGLFTVDNFVYDDSSKNLSFNFSGELVKVETNTPMLDVPQKRKKINGKIMSNKVKATTCTSFTSDLHFETNNLTFATNFNSGSHDPNLPVNQYNFRFFSNNGYRAIIKSKIDLWNFDKGTYTFDQNTIENRIDLEQYTGIFRATQLLWIRPQDWKKFQTAGSYTILEHTTINDEKVTRGEMDLQVYDNGALIHNITNGKFVVTDF